MTHLAFNVLTTGEMQAKKNGKECLLSLRSQVFLSHRAIIALFSLLVI
jgi:hypothetical protein